MYHYIRNAYVGWRKGVPNDLYWPCLWADTKYQAFYLLIILLSLPFTLPLLFITVVAMGLTKFVEIMSSFLGWVGEVTGARLATNKLEYQRAEKMKPVREWHRANKSMRYQKVERQSNAN